MLDHVGRVAETTIRLEVAVMLTSLSRHGQASQPDNALRCLARAEDKSLDPVRSSSSALGLIDFFLQKVVQRRPQYDDGAELADLVPCRCDRRAQDVGAKLDLEGDGKPASQLQSNDLFQVCPTR